jgi:hypothetical protein
MNLFECLEAAENGNQLLAVIEQYLIQSARSV